MLVLDRKASVKVTVDLPTMLTLEQLKLLLDETTQKLSKPGNDRKRQRFVRNAWYATPGLVCTKGCESPIELRYVPRIHRPFVITICDGSRPDCDHLGDKMHSELELRGKVEDITADPDRSSESDELTEADDTNNGDDSTYEPTSAEIVRIRKLLSEFAEALRTTAASMTFQA